MGEKKDQTLKRLTQERFQEEVARELGISPVKEALPRRDIPSLEAEVGTEDQHLPDS